MKRLLGLVMACAFALTSVTAAQAIEVKTSGWWLFTYGWTENVAKGNGSFIDNDDRETGKNADSFRAGLRVRPQIDFVASENLSATLLFEIGTVDWGRNAAGGATAGRGAGGALDADGVNIETKRAYLNWIIPETDIKVRMGIQAFWLPWAYGGYGANPVLSNEGAGIIVSSPIVDGLGITAFWLRAFDAFEFDTDNMNKLDETDVFGMTMPITAIDGVSITPWALYASIGADSGFWGYNGRSTKHAGQASWRGTDTDAWYVGTAISVTAFDPLTFVFDAMYGDLHGGDDNMADSTPGSEGWLVSGALRYKLDWGTPALFAWYASGDDEDAIKNGEFGRLPSLNYDWGPGYTSFGFDGSSSDLYNDWHVSITSVGLWGVGVELAKMSFVDKLSHTVRIAYYAGTNDADLVKNNPGSFNRRMNNELFIGEFQYMTDEDYAIEVNFDHEYKIYENLTAYLDLGYINMNLDDDTWKNTSLGSQTDDAWKASLTFLYQY